MVEEKKKPAAKKVAASKVAAVSEVKTTKVAAKKAPAVKKAEPAAWPFPPVEAVAEVKKAPAAAPVAAAPVAAAPAAVAKKPAAKKAAAPKAAPKQEVAQPSAQERYRMVETAAYYIAERSGWQGCTTDHWAAAELEIAAKLAK